MDLRLGSDVVLLAAHCHGQRWVGVEEGGTHAEDHAEGEEDAEGEHVDEDVGP